MSEDEITIERLNEAYRIAAELVARYGNVHLPVFERLHREVQKAKSGQEMKSLAMAIASGRINTDSKG